jgi:mRNA interferase MazF
MRRGDVVIVADRSGQFTGKPRPALVVQSDVFPVVDSVTVCPITSFETSSPLLRISITPVEGLSLARPSWIAINQVTTVFRHRISEPIGRISDSDLARTNTALAIFLGIA